MPKQTLVIDKRQFRNYPEFHSVGMLSETASGWSLRNMELKSELFAADEGQQSPASVVTWLPRHRIFA